jgi:HK97 family phage prohead protease
MDAADTSKGDGMMPVKMEREYRDMLRPLRIEQRADGEASMIVEGLATTFDQPYLMFEDYDGTQYFEQIDRRALDNADMSDVILQYNHGGHVLARISNGTLALQAEDAGLRVNADLSKSTAAQALYEEIRSGLVTKMSWAFIIKEDSFDRETRTRTIRQIRKVYDVSAVSFPANDNTSISARAYFGGVIDGMRRETLERQKQLLKLKIELMR